MNCTVYNVQWWLLQLYLDLDLMLLKARGLKFGWVLFLRHMHVLPQLFLVDSKIFFCKICQHCWTQVVFAVFLLNWKHTFNAKKYFRMLQIFNFIFPSSIYFDAIFRASLFCERKLSNLKGIHFTQNVAQQVKSFFVECCQL